MRKLRKPESKPVSADSVECKTIDGKTVALSEIEAQKLAGCAICTGGSAHGCYTKTPHKFVTPQKYDDYSRNLRGISVSKDESTAAYRCRKCGTFMGCRTCAGNIEDLVCTVCHDWANQIAETVHGKMVSPELASHGMKLLDMMQNGKIDEEGFKKLWQDAIAGSAHPK